MTKSRILGGLVSDTGLLGDGALTATDVGALPSGGGTLTGNVTFAAGQTWPTFNQNTTGSASTVTTAAQPNITSVGTLTSLSVSGNTTLGSVQSANSTYTPGNGYTSGSTAERDLFIDGITVGMASALSALPVGYPITINSFNTTVELPWDGFYMRVTDIVPGAFVSITSISFSTTSYTNSANIVGSLNVQNGIAGNGANIININANNISSGTVSSSRIVGSYSNITAVGTLTSLAVSGTISVRGMDPLGVANSAFGQANLAYTAANTAVTTGQANVGAGLITTTAAYQANTGAARIGILGRADSAFGQANLAYGAANTAVTSGQANTGAGLITVTGAYQANVGSGLITTTNAYQANTGAGLLTRLPLAGGTMTGAITFAGGQTWPTFNQNTTGNAATATALQTARTIGGVSFNGTANINLPGVNTAGNQNTTGSAATLASGLTNWSGTGVLGNVVGLMAWKNYANNHVIFDASNSTSPSGGAVNSTNAAVAWSASYPTLMGWNGSSTYGVRVDSARVSDNTTGNAATVGSRTPSASSGVANRVVVADGNGYIFNNYFNSTDNSVASGVTAVMVKAGDNYYRSGTAAAVATFISGQSMNISGTATYLSGSGQINTIVGKNGTTADINNANDTGSMSVRGDASFPASISFHRTGAYAINVGLSTGNNFVIGGWSASANAFVMSGGGALTMLNNITAYSDERVKTNWRDLRPDFIERLAEVKHGIYDRTDQVSTQVGVSAQSLQKILEHAVMEGDDGHLSVAYGNAALVAAVKLAERVVDQEARIKKLETLIEQLLNKE